MNNKRSDHSFYGVLNIALPLIVSSFGWTLMITFDRLMLARYDINIMNAVVSLGTLLFLFEWSITSITISSEIYAGQYNGLSKTNMTPVATWQMLIFSFISFSMFILVGLFGGKYIVPEEYYNEAGNFFVITMCFLGFAPATAAINGFFIGIQRTKIVLYNTVAANILNIILSYSLIFGVGKIIPPLGASGAAIATSISILLQFLVALIAFLNWGKEYGTRNFKYNKEIFNGCLKLGIPTSIGIITEMVGNYVAQIIILTMAYEYVSNHNITLNVFIFFTFFINGMNKAVSSIAANLIGEKRIDEMDKLLASSIKLYLIFFILVFIVTVILREKTPLLYTNDPKIIYFCSHTLPWLAIYFFFDGIGWIIAGIVTAGGDTKFVMAANSLVIWLFRVIPLYIFLKIGITSIAIGWIIGAFSTFIYALSFYLRYKSNSWLKLNLS